MDIKDKRQKVACELRKRAKEDLPFIDARTLYGIIFGELPKFTKDTTVAEYDEYDIKLLNALADLIEPTCDFCQRVMPCGMTKTTTNAVITL